MKTLIFALVALGLSTLCGAGEPASGSVVAQVTAATQHFYAALNVKAYGDTAVATFYTEGSTTTGANRPASEGIFRASYVWVKRSDGWKIAHFHLSPLKGS